MSPKMEKRSKICWLIMASLTIAGGIRTTGPAEARTPHVAGIPDVAASSPACRGINLGKCEINWLRKNLAHPAPAGGHKYDASTMTAADWQKVGADVRTMVNWRSCIAEVAPATLLDVAYCLDEGTWNKVKDQLSWKGNTSF